MRWFKKKELDLDYFINAKSYKYQLFYDFIIKRYDGKINIHYDNDYKSWLVFEVNYTEVSEKVYTIRDTDTDVLNLINAIESLPIPFMIELKRDKKLDTILYENTI
jgi:hypothetical protein